MDYVHYRVYADLGSLTFARLASHRFSSSPLVPLLYLLPLPWPCLMFHLCCHYTKSVSLVSVLKKWVVSSTFDQYHLFFPQFLKNICQYYLQIEEI